MSVVDRVKSALSVVSVIRAAFAASVDLVLAVAATLAVDAFVVGGTSIPILRLVLALAVVFVLPGYVWVAALRPEGTRAPQAGGAVVPGEAASGTGSGTVSPEDTVGLDERLLLSVGTSIGIVTAVGFALNYSGVGIAAESALTALTLVVGAGAVVAFVRRLSVAPERRFGVRDLLAPVRDAAGLLSVRTPTDLAISLVLIASLVIVAGGAASVATSDAVRGPHTELGLLAENENGTLVASDYPSEAGSDRPLVVGIGNNEGERVTYTVVVQVDDPSTTASDPTELDRFEVTVSAGETRRTAIDALEQVDPAPTRRRLSVLLYEGAAPAEADRDTAYRSVHIWIDAADEGDDADDAE